MKLSSCIIAVILSLISPICFAQSLDAIEKADKEVLEVWNATPLTFRRAIFVSEEPAGFGSYTDRDSNAFKQGEPLIIYSEPVGYAWREKGDGSYTIGFAMDLASRRLMATSLRVKKTSDVKKWSLNPKHVNLCFTQRLTLRAHRLAATSWESVCAIWPVMNSE